MRVLFYVLMFVHGLIHLMGFVKAFQLAEISQIKAYISKPVGVLWLLALVLFLAAIVSLYVRMDWWWAPAMAASILSQALIISVWRDAKFGTIVNVIVIVVAVVALAAWQFHRQVEQEARKLLAENNTSDASIIIEQMLEPYPGSVQTWLRNIGLVGKKNITSATFNQIGWMKLKPEQKDWSPASAVQYVRTDEPAFLWKVDMRMMPLVDVLGKDSYVDGIAEMTMKVAGLLPVVHVVDNPQTNESTLQRYLLELPWYPYAALSPYIVWEEVDTTTAKATLSYKGVTGSATYFFDEDGNLLKVSALRYKDNKEDFRLECIGEVQEFGIFGGILIPTKIDVSWMIEEGKFTWYRVELTDVKFN